MYPFLFLFSCLCLVSQIHQTAASHDFVRDACKKYEEEEWNFCYDLVSSDLRADLKSNFSGLLTIFINHSIPYASDTYKYIVEQLKRPDLSHMSRQAFELCKIKYKEGIDDLKTSLQDLLNDPNTDMVDGTNLATGAFQMCDLEFDGTAPYPPYLLSRHKGLGQFLELALGAANFLQCKHILPCYYE